VDQALHVLLLDPRLYQRVCDGLLQQIGDNRQMRTLPHNPSGGLNREEQNRRYALTVQEYTAVFQHAPVAPIWQAAVTVSSQNQVQEAQPIVDSGQIFVVETDGRIITLCVQAIESIYCIKQKNEDFCGIPPEQQRLIYAGKQLEDTRTLGDYKVHKDAVMHCVLRLRGC
jgi:hypothetical protein